MPDRRAFGFFSEMGIAYRPSETHTRGSAPRGLETARTGSPRECKMIQSYESLSGPNLRPSDPIGQELLGLSNGAPSLSRALAHQSFFAYVSEEVEDLKRTSGVTDTHGAFLLWVLSHHFGLDGLTAQKTQTISAKGDSGIDAFWLDEARNRLNIVQAKTSQPLTSLKSFGTDAARDLAFAIGVLRPPEVIKEPTLRRASLEYKEAIAKGRSIEPVILVSGNSSPALDWAVEI